MAGDCISLLMASSLADDRIALRSVCSHTRWQLYEAPTCREALELVRRHSIPVVICSSELPDGDWKTLYAALAELPQRPRLIVCSRQADHHLWAEVLSLGAYDMLVTPFQSSEVFRVIPLAWHSSKHERERMAASREAGPPEAAAAANR